VTAVTLLVPFYVDAGEVEPLASFIAEIDPEIPYSLLLFHPDFPMDDLPVTPRAQVNRCYEAARAHLNRVTVGNRQLLVD
jgi:pyruvate formate lyase activating enzyme